MSNIDREILTRRIRDAVDIVDLVSGYVRLNRSGASLKGLCPFHEEKTPSFYVHPAKQFFKCHGCGAGGDVFKFVQLKEKVEFVEARRLLAERANIEIDFDRGGAPGGPGKSELFKANQWAQQVFRRYFEGTSGGPAREYVARRGISEEMSKTFGIGLAVESYDALIRQAAQARIDLKTLLAAGLVKESDRGGCYDTFRNRLMFPIHDSTGRIIAFGGRTLGDDPAKYLNTPATAIFDKSSNLFGLDRAREGISRSGRAIVVEGYTDCIMAHQFGFTETVATLGTAMTDAHAALLRRHTDRVVLLFDSDAAGQRAADRGLSVAMIGGLDVILTRVPAGKDPCDYLLSAGREGFESVLKAGVPALEFKWRQVAEAFETGQTGPGRRRAIEAFIGDLASWLGQQSLDAMQTGFLLNGVGKLIGLPAEEVHRRLTATLRDGRTRPSGLPGAEESRRPNDRTFSAEQEAFRQIIEVLLNEPEHFAAVGDDFDPSLIRDPGLSAVAGALVVLLRSEDEFRLVDLIGRFDSPALSALITDLAERGERQGKYGETVAGAIACLRSCRSARAALTLADQVRVERGRPGETDGQAAPESEDDRLRAFVPNNSQPHFAPPKARRRVLG